MVFDFDGKIYIQSDFCRIMKKEELIKLGISAYVNETNEDFVKLLKEIK